MRTALQVLTPPSKEPVLKDLAKLHCRIDHTEDDVLIDSYIVVARTMAEMYLSRALMQQTLLWTVVPSARLCPSVHLFRRRGLDLPRAPVQTILQPVVGDPSGGLIGDPTGGVLGDPAGNGVVVFDERGNETSIAAATLPIASGQCLQGYIVDTSQTPARLRIGLDTVLSDGRTLRQATLEHIQVRFIAGYASTKDIPQPIIQAILLTVAFLYEHRGDAGGELPQAAEWLLDPYRLPWVA